MKKLNYKNINFFLNLEKKKIIEIKENGEINLLIEKKNKNKYKSITYRNERGYLIVRKRYKGIYYHTYAHRLIWTYFKGKIPKELTINHIDGKKDNNNIKNLELATQKYQMYHAMNIIKTVNDMKKENNTNSKITINDARDIRSLRRRKYKLREIKEKLNLDITLKQICIIVNKKQWIEDNEVV